MDEEKKSSTGLEENVAGFLFGWVPVLGALFWIGSLILWLLLMIKALRGERYALPVIGKMADGKGDL